MHIAFAASECVPFSKTGGLADVIGALPPALATSGPQGHRLSSALQANQARQSAQGHLQHYRPFDDRYRFCSVLDGGMRAGVQFYFIDYPPFFDRDALYGTALGDYHDNAERFALFSRAVLEAAKVLGVPDVLHCHDWQTALVPILLKTLYDRRPRVCQRPVRLHHSQPGLPGTVPAGDPAAAHAALGPVHHVEAGILRQGEFPEGRDHHGRLHHHREPEIQPGNPDRGIRLRAGGRLARARGHRHRHPERRGLQRVESRKGSSSSPRTTRPKTSTARRSASATC